MPVIRLAAYPDSRVYTRAGVIVCNNMIFHKPMLMGFYEGGEREILEFGMSFFQNVDWSARVDLRLTAPWYLIIFVDTPGGMLTLERCSRPTGPVPPPYLI
jgi:hypothetical protein